MKYRSGQIFDGFFSSPWMALAIALLAVQVISVSIAMAGFSSSFGAGVADGGWFLALLVCAWVCARNAISSRQSIRLFWIFISISCLMWAANAWSWFYRVAVLHNNHPDYLFAEVPLFLQPILLIAAIISRPQLKSLGDKPYQILLKLLQLLLFTGFVYAFFLAQDTYKEWNSALIERGGLLYAVETLLMLAVLSKALVDAHPPWRTIYTHLLGASFLFSLGSLAAHSQILSATSSASFDNLLFAAATFWLTWLCLHGKKKAPLLEENVQPTPIDQNYTFIPVLLAAVIIPLFGVWELLQPNEPSSLRLIREYIVLLAILFFVVVALSTAYINTRNAYSNSELAHNRLLRALTAGRSILWERDLQTGQGVWIGDLQSIYGIPTEFHLNTEEDFLAFLHPDDRQMVSDSYRAPGANLAPFKAEFRVIRRDGKVVWVSSTGEYVCGKDGNPVQMRGMSMDITERKLAELALKKSEQTFSKLFRESPMAIIISTLEDQRHVDVNAAFERLSGWKRDEVIGRTPFEIRAWADPAEGHRHAQRMERDGFVRCMRALFRTRDGTEWPALISTEQIELEGKPFLLSVLEDISELEKAETKLRQNEQRLRAVVGSAMDAIIAVDEQHLIVLFNSAAEKMFCCSAGDAIGASIERFIPSRYRAEHKNHIRRFGESDQTSSRMDSSGILRALRTNGEEFPIEVSISRTEEDGKRLFTAIIRDIGDRLKSEEALRNSEQRSRLAFQAARMYAYEWDPINEVMERSPEFTDVLGTDQPLQTRKHDLMIQVHPDDRELITADIAKITPENSSSSVQYRLLHPDGNVSWMERRARATFDEQCQLQKIVGVVSDITSQKITEIALKESEERFRLAANTAPVLIWMSNSDHERIFVNETWLKFTGRPLWAELCNGWKEGIHPDDLVEYLRAYARAFDRREPFNAQYRLRHCDGEYRYMLDTGVPRMSPSGSLAGFIGSCIDVTSLKHAEEALKSVGRRLIQAHEEERNHFARELHDDINQRIALLSLEFSRISKKLVDAPIALQRQVSQARQNLSDIAGEIQALSHRLHSSKLEYLGLVKAADSLCNEFAERQNVKIEFTATDMPSTIPREVALCLFRVLQESLQNALKHSGVRLFNVELRGLPTEIRLTVSDLGIGFNPGETEKYMGIGLVSMRERLQLVGGRLSIDSTAGGGTTIQAHVSV